MNANLSGVGDFLEAAVLQFAAAEKALAEIRRRDARCGATSLLGPEGTARCGGKHRCGLVTHGEPGSASRGAKTRAALALASYREIYHFADTKFVLRLTNRRQISA